MSTTEILALINDSLQAIIVIFGTAVVLYNLQHARHDRITRAFVNLVAYVVIVYLTELMASRTALTASNEPWLRLEWIGIALVPASQFHFADALLVSTGARSTRRRLFVRVCYLTGIAFILLVGFTNLIAGEFIDSIETPHLRAGPLFPLFILYFLGITGASIWNIWRARKRTITSSTRRRITMILATFLAAPIGVFPYLLLSPNPTFRVPVFLWIVLITGNIVVGLLLGLLTYHLAYFGATSPDRVVRVRLFKFMARVPMTASIVLLVYVLVGRTSSLLGLHAETAQAFTIVATVMLVEWAIHAYKRPLERLFHLNRNPDVRRIQDLSERLLTTRDMHQFLESLLLTTCEALRTPSAFVAAITPEGAKLEVTVGKMQDAHELENKDWQKLMSGETEQALVQADSFVLWHNFWLRPLYNRQGDITVGILGMQARNEEPDLNGNELDVFDRLAEQAAFALEDRFLQQEVFGAVEGLLPQITALQKRRSEVQYSGEALLTDPAGTPNPDTLINNPNFSKMVKDALTHYWGGPKLTDSPLMRLQIVQTSLTEHDGNATRAMRAILERAIEQQRPDGERSLTTTEWILYNILELKFVQGKRVRDVARRLAMSESDLYRKQRIAIENVARAVSQMERTAIVDGD